MKAYKCDWCKKLFEGEPQATIKLRIYYMEEPTEFQLCQECWVKIKNLIEQETK